MQNSWMKFTASPGGIEWAEARFTGQAFAPHRHDTYGIGFTTKGIQTFGYRGIDRHCLPGNGFVLHPDELHDGRPGTEDGYGYRIVYIPPDLIAAALGHGPLPFVVDPVSTGPSFTRLVAATFPDSQDTARDIHEVDTIAALSRGLVTAAGASRSKSETLDIARLSRVREHLLAVAVDGVSMTDLETQHGVDRYQLSRGFRRRYGVSPHRFIIMRRLDIAKRTIRAGLPLADAALAAGFADQSHLTRHFRRAFGLTPGRWRALLVRGPAR